MKKEEYAASTCQIHSPSSNAFVFQDHNHDEDGDCSYFHAQDTDIRWMKQNERTTECTHNVKTKLEQPDITTPQSRS